jgi:hypothetical protein
MAFKSCLWGIALILCSAFLICTNNAIAGLHVPGDANSDGIVDIDDAVFIVEYIFAGGPEPAPYEAGDANCSSEIDIDDVVYLIAYIFDGGPPPCSGVDPSGSLIDMTGCNVFEKGLITPDSSSFWDCIEYEYDGESILTLQHINAGFNCCPEIEINFHFEGNVITIEQIELEGMCDCNCLFDLDYQIENLAPGEYTIAVVEPYTIEVDAPLEFDVDLSTAASGEFCVYRFHDPWGQ